MYEKTILNFVELFSLVVLKLTIVDYVRVTCRNLYFTL